MLFINILHAHAHVHAVTATNSDMQKVGNTFLQLKLVLDKGMGTDDVFMGAYISTIMSTP